MRGSPERNQRLHPLSTTLETDSSAFSVLLWRALGLRRLSRTSICSTNFTSHNQHGAPAHRQVHSLTKTLRITSEISRNCRASVSVAGSSSRRKYALVNYLLRISRISRQFSPNWSNDSIFPRLTRCSSYSAT